MTLKGKHWNGYFPKKVQKTKPEFYISEECQDNFDYITLLRLITSIKNGLVIYKKMKKLKLLLSLLVTGLKTKELSTNTYSQTLKSLKEKIKAAQLRATLTVNN